jgi:Zn-dependent protease with chaperone function
MKNIAIALKATVLAGIGMAAFISWVLLWNVGASVTGAYFHSSGGARLAMTAVANLSGILSGLLLVFAMAPWLVRQILPLRKDVSFELIRLLGAPFERAGLKTPKIFVVDQEVSNAIVTGFGRGRGPFAPALYVSSALLGQLSPEELEGVICHEASHLALGHLARRLKRNASAVLQVSLGVFAWFTFAYLFLPKAVILFSATLIPWIAVAIPSRLMHRMMREQEHEADEFAVTRLGAPAEDLVRAITKLESKNGGPPRRATTHPLSGERVSRILALGTDTPIQSAS